MKSRIFIIMGLAAAALLVVGCSGERGLQGDSGTAECIQCHSDNTTIVAISHQWENSIHAAGGNFDHNNSPCADCHTSEGFVEFLASGSGGSPENPSSIGCFTCHEPHTNHNFNLRTAEPVTLASGAVYDKGLSNLCANCHHARPTSPLIGEPTSITSSRWGPHHGPHADILSGNGAYVFAGYTYGNSSHTTGVTEGCPTCHMATAFGDLGGGHTMNVTYDDGEELVAGCNTSGCHSDLEEFNYNGVQDSVEVLIESLHTLLVEAGYVDSTTGLVRASSGSPLVLTADQAGALFNFYFFEEDRSMGVHNTNYAFDALNASIESLSD